MFGGRLISYVSYASETTVGLSEQFQDFDRRLTELRGFL